MTSYDVARTVLRPVLRVGMRWIVEGAERIPESGPVLVAANHVSFLDPPAVGYVLDTRGREAKFLTMAELFRVPGLGRVLQSMGQIPVERASSRAAASLEPAREALARGECVVVFPEGGLSGDLEPQPGRTGIARLARAAGMPVLPVGLWGTHRVHAKGRIPRWRPGLAVAVAIGPPVVIAGESHHEGTDRVMAAVCVQVARARELYPLAPRPGRSAWWVRDPQTARLRPSGNGRAPDAGAGAGG